MPIYRTIISEGREISYFTVSHRVGPKAFNDPDDVMLVQASLKYLPEQLSGTSYHDRPSPTGKWDKMTARAIWNFQKTQSLEADWYIDPLSPAYASLVINRRENVQWTMFRLYNLVRIQTMYYDDHWGESAKDVMNTLVKKWSQLALIRSGMNLEAEL